MKEHMIAYDFATGAERWRISGTQGDAKRQRLPLGTGILIVSEGAFNTVVITDIDAGEIRPVLWEQVKEKRDAVIDGGAPTPAGVVDSDGLSRSNINGAVMAAVLSNMAGQPFAVTWTMADNSVALLNAEQMIAVGVAVMTHVNAAHEHARVLRVAIESAETTAALLQIDLHTGWTGAGEGEA